MFGRTSGHPPFDWDSSGRKSTAVTLWGRNGRTICGSEHARHRSIRIIIDSDVGYWAFRYSQGIRKRAKFRRRDQVMPCLSVLVLLLLRRGCACARCGSESPSNHCIAWSGRFPRMLEVSNYFFLFLFLAACPRESDGGQRKTDDYRSAVDQWTDGGVALWQPKQCRRGRAMRNLQPPRRGRQRKMEEKRAWLCRRNARELSFCPRQRTAWSRHAERNAQVRLADASC